MPNRRLLGTIQRLPTDSETGKRKGFGFIRTDDGQDYFFHHSETDGQFERLQVGQRVSFDGTEGTKGLRANAVRVEIGNRVSSY